MGQKPIIKILKWTAGIFLSLVFIVLIAGVGFWEHAKANLPEKDESCFAKTVMVEIGGQVFGIPRATRPFIDDGTYPKEPRTGLLCYRENAVPIKAQKVTLYPRGMDTVIDAKFQGEEVFKTASRVSISFYEDRKGTKTDWYKSFESVLETSSVVKSDLPLKYGYYEFENRSLNHKFPFSYIYRRL